MQTSPISFASRKCETSARRLGGVPPRTKRIEFPPLGLTGVANNTPNLSSMFASLLLYIQCSEVSTELHITLWVVLQLFVTGPMWASLAHVRLYIYYDATDADICSVSGISISLSLGILTEEGEVLCEETFEPHAGVWCYHYICRPANN